MRLTVTIAGRQAQRLIEAAEDATVIAVFARSLYLRDKAGRIACFGGPGLGKGPLNALCSSWPDTVSIEANATARWRAGVLSLNKLDLDAARAHPWQPATSMAWNGPTLKRGLARLAAIPARGLGRMIPALVSQTDASSPSPPHSGGEGGARSRSDGEGEVVLRRSENSDPPHPLAALAPFPPEAGGEGYDSIAARLERALNSSLLTLASWLRDPAGEPPAAIATLLGLGSGLTPAGDDALGGALIALRLFGRADTADRLAAWLLPLARTATSDISCAHFSAAAEGEGAAALHDTLAALAADDASLDDGVARLDRIGHSSGWDALAGAVAALLPHSRSL